MALVALCFIGFGEVDAASQHAARLPVPMISDLPGATVGSGSGDLSAALKSMVAPGWGQQAQDRSHWWVYPVVEGVIWAGWFDARRTGGLRRDRYRELAWEAARSPFWSGERMDGPWEYYERMGQWRASGVYDRHPDTRSLVPETNPMTYNGWVWELARQLHFEPAGTEPSPADEGYEAAIEYYRARAVTPAFRWDWNQDPEARDRFRSLVKSSDDAYRRATTYIGVAFLNHFISAAEAWLHDRSPTVRSVPARIQTRLGPLRRTDGWQLEIRMQRNPSRRPH